MEHSSLMRRHAHRTHSPQRALLSLDPACSQLPDYAIHIQAMTISTLHPTGYASTTTHCNMTDKHKTTPHTCMQFPDCASHIHSVKSSLPASTTSPFGCHVTHSTPSPGPSSVWTQLPSDTHHTRTVESRLAVASKLPAW